MKKCVYCGSEIPEDSVLDVCMHCGHQVWGEKMFQTILENMQGAKANGNLLNSESA